MNWLQNPQANYVIAAYGVAAVLLIGLVLASWCRARSMHMRWQRLSNEASKDKVG